MTLSLVPVLLFLFSSPLANAQASDSCASNLTAISYLLPFNATSLSCLAALESANFVLRYGRAGPSLWSFVLSAADPSSYVAVGFSDDGGMVGSSAMAGWIAVATGVGIVKQYSLGAKSPSKCSPDQGRLEVVHGKSVAARIAPRLYLAFQISVDQPPPYLIFAVGPKGKVPSTSNYLLSQHRDEDSLAVNYTAAAGSIVTGGSGGGGGGSDPAFGAPRQHALLGMLGWGALVPVGIVVARYAKRWDPFWFYSHMAIQGLGFGLGLVGIVVGFGLDDDGIPGVDLHKSLGVAITIGGCLQVTALLARPDKSSKVRKYWNWYHHYIGRATAACAMANIFFGLKIAEEVNGWQIGYGVFLGLWAIVTVLLEIRSRFMNEERLNLISIAATRR